GHAGNRTGPFATLERHRATHSGFAPVAQPLAKLGNQHLLTRKDEKSLHAEDAEPRLIATWNRFPEPPDHLWRRGGQVTVSAPAEELVERAFDHDRRIAVHCRRLGQEVDIPDRPSVPHPGIAKIGAGEQRERLLR